MAAAKVRLSIAGSSYVISTTDSEAYVQGLAQRLSEDMNQIMAAAPSASVTSAAVLVALDYLDELKKSTGSADNMRAQIKDYLEDAARASQAAEEARREVERLKAELHSLKNKMGEK